MCLIELALFVPPVEQAWFSAKHDPGFNKGFKLLVLGKDCFSHEKIDLFTKVPTLSRGGKPRSRFETLIRIWTLPASHIQINLGLPGFGSGFPQNTPGSFGIRNKSGFDTTNLRSNNEVLLKMPRSARNARPPWKSAWKSNTLLSTLLNF